MTKRNIHHQIGWELLFVLVDHPEQYLSRPNNSKQHMLKWWKASCMRIRWMVVLMLSMLIAHCINNCPSQDKNNTILAMNPLRFFRSMWKDGLVERVKCIKKFQLSWLKKHIKRNPMHYTVSPTRMPHAAQSMGPTWLLMHRTQPA